MNQKINNRHHIIVVYDFTVRIFRLLTVSFNQSMHTRIYTECVHLSIIFNSTYLSVRFLFHCHYLYPSLVCIISVNVITKQKGLILRLKLQTKPMAPLYRDAEGHYLINISMK